MARPRKLRYDPSMSVAEMMDKYHVSEATVRSYIQSHHIDLRRENKLKKIAACKKHLEEHPNASKKEVAAATKIGLSTVRRYWDNITKGEDVETNEKKSSERKRAEEQEKKNQIKVLKSIPKKTIREYIGESSPQPKTEQLKEETKKVNPNKVLKSLPNETIFKYLEKATSKKNKKVASKKYELWSDVLKDIPSLFEKADADNVSELREFLLEKPEMPMLFVGSGGQQGFFPALLYSMNKGMGMALTPLQFASLSDEAVKNSRILLLSRSGHNDDIKYAAKRAIELNPENTACLTTKHKEGRENYFFTYTEETPARLFYFNHSDDLKAGFLGIRGKFYKYALLYRAFSGVESVSKLVPVNLNYDNCFKAEATLDDLEWIEHFCILYSGYGEPVAHDFESVFAEAGMGSVQVCDYRNYCHGRFIFPSNFTENKSEPRFRSNVAMVLLITPREKRLAEDVRNHAVSSKTPVITIETEFNSALATIDLLVKSHVLIGYIGEQAKRTNPHDPHNYNRSEVNKDYPKNHIKFISELKANGELQYVEGTKKAAKPQPKGKTKLSIEELKLQIDENKIIERKNSQSLQCLPPPTLDTLTKKEKYDASKYLCCAFRKKEDTWEDKAIPFGNMNGGFEFDIQGNHFKNSEEAYICGMFSDNTPEHLSIQHLVIAQKSGYDSKRIIRRKHEKEGRQDWYDFNLQWMIYVVWQKIQGNKEFRELLMAVPENATLIEDTSFLRGSKKNDTTVFWGAKNLARKKYGKDLENYVKATHPDLSKPKRFNLWLSEFNEFTDFGVYEGKNVMGKILTICKRCLHDGTEPPIDYELLKSKNIYLFGKPVDFEAVQSEPQPMVHKATAKKTSAKDVPLPNYLLGTITGDMIGKPYERRANSIKTTIFPLFEKRCKYTDDTVLTIAIMDWLMTDKDLSWEILADRFVHYGTRYRFKGRDRCFGDAFTNWLKDENREFGRVAESNGAAMRVSPVGWFFNTVEEVENAAKIQASLTHNSEEAIEGAQVAAVAVLLARQGKTKDEIKTFIEERYGWNLNFDIDKYRTEYEWTPLCRKTVEGALVSFLNSSNFETCIRNAVSLGGDADTIGAIAGSIAEAFYGGIPEDIKKEVLRRAIPDEFKDILAKFGEAIGRKIN